MRKNVQTINIVNDAIIKDISPLVHELNCGTVTITVDNSKIVEVEVSKRNKFHDIWITEAGGGI